MSTEMSLDVTQCHPEKNSLTPSLQDEPLSDRQRLALELILTGKTDLQVAKAVGVCRRTILRWRHSDADFIAELRRRRQVQWHGVVDKLRALLEPAVDVLAEQLHDRYDRTRFRAASTLLRLTNMKSVLAVKEE